VGGFKDTLSEDASELDEWLDRSESPTNEEITHMALAATLKDIEEFEIRLLRLCDRAKYYHENVDYDTLEFLAREIQRIKKGFP